MFCYQCEQTQGATGCVSIGVCGKSPETAALQDLMVLALTGLAFVARRANIDKSARRANINKSARHRVDETIREALFATVTNVNFDDRALYGLFRNVIGLRDGLKEKISGPLPFSATFDVGNEPREWCALADRVGIIPRRLAHGHDLVGLQELLTYGLKGMAAYALHAAELSYEDEKVNDFMLEGRDALNDPTPTVENTLATVMRCGEACLETLALLDKANTESLGDPQPTLVCMGVRKGKAILVSGHDLADLKALLDQTMGMGINVYTHGEMLPAHAYPGLKKYPHLAGHFGGAWMRQKQEFPHFPGPIVMTTNCLMQPGPDYKGRLFTRGVVGWPDVTHLPDRDFSPVVAAALEAPGFDQDEEGAREHWAGFGHKAVINVAGAIVDAVKSGQIKRFMLIGGCDGAKPGRNYFTEMAENAPEDWAILTLRCGKFRLTDLDLGTIAGLPRLLDMGQCNDSYSAIRVAMALAEAFETDVNHLPLSLVISWYEQKAVTVLLALLHLGVRNIRLGPTLPAFVSPAILQVLVDKFAIRLAGPSAQADLAAIKSGQDLPVAA